MAEPVEEISEKVKEASESCEPVLLDIWEDFCLDQLCSHLNLAEHERTHPWDPVACEPPLEEKPALPQGIETRETRRERLLNTLLKDSSSENNKKIKVQTVIPLPILPLVVEKITSQKTNRREQSKPTFKDYFEQKTKKNVLSLHSQEQHKNKEERKRSPSRNQRAGELKDIHRRLSSSIIL